MERSTNRLIWHSWLLLVWIGCEFQPLYQATMVKLIDATLGGHISAKPDGVLKPENAKKVASRAKIMLPKDVDSQVMRDIKERFPELTFVDCFVRQIGGKSLSAEIEEKNSRPWQTEKGFRARRGSRWGFDGRGSRSRKRDWWRKTRLTQSARP